MRLIVTFLVFAWGGMVMAELPEQAKDTALIQAQISDKPELYSKLEAVQAVTQSEDYQQQSPIVFLLDNKEAQLFLRKHYRTQKDLVDLASRLSAFGYVELKVEQDYLDSHALGKSDIPSFLIVVKDSLAEK